MTAHLGVVRYDTRRAAYREDDARTRRGQVEELAAWMDGLGHGPPHLVLAGDLNVAERFGGDGGEATPSADYAHLRAWLPLADAYREHDPAGRGFTFDPEGNAHAGRGRLRATPGQRIDYVLYRAGTGPRVQAATIVLREAPTLSDHYGLLVDFDF